MPTLTVRTPRDPFAVIEVRNSRYEAVATGTGELVADVQAGRYSLITAAAGREDEREVDVTADVAVEVDLGDHPSAAPTAGSSTIVAAHARATVELSERLVAAAPGRAAVGVVLGRPAGAPSAPVPLWSDGTPAVSLSGASGPLALSWSGGDDHIETGVVVEPGALLATIGGTSATAIVVPAWRGWQTLLFLPVTAEGIATAVAVMHVVPLGTPWRPELPIAELFDHLHSALVERPEITEQAAGALRARMSGTPQSPLLHLMLAHVAATGDGPLARALVADSLHVLDASGVREVVAADVDALLQTARSSAAVPVLGRSADLLMASESRSPGSIVGAAADAIASRWSSPLWFEWSPSASSPAPVSPASLTEDAWRHELAGATAALAVPGVVDRVVRAHGQDPATARLLAYLQDESARLRMSPSDVLMAAHPGGVVRGAGLPAVGALRAMHHIAAFAPPVGVPPPKPPKPPEPPVPVPSRWLRRLLWGGAAVAALAGLGALAVVALDDDDDPSPDATVEVTIETTPPPTDPTVESTEVATVPTDVTATTPPPATAAPTTLEPNDAPIVEPVPLLFALAETPFDVQIVARDPEGETLTARIVSGAAGVVENRGEGLFTYLPPPGSAFPDSFTVGFSDGVNESTAVVSIEVLPNVTAEAQNSPVGEGEGSLAMVITLTEPALSSVRVAVEATNIDPKTDPPDPFDNAAEPGDDFEEPARLVEFAQGVREISMKLAIIDDDVFDEGDEHFVVRVAVLWSGERIPFDVPVTITDNDTSEG